MPNDFENYNFPSDKKLGKFPVISIAGDANEYAMWLYNHPEIDRRVPPVYPDFIVLHTFNKNQYEIFVHYNSDFTAYCYRCRMDGTTILTGEMDYDTINGTTVKANGGATARASELYDIEWLKSTLLASALLIIAVQAYMLYFKPEIVEQIYTPSESANKSPKKRRKRVTAEPIKIRKSKIKRITLDAHGRPPRDINYHKLSWHVRGHYRHVGKEKKLKYIQPFTCNRGGKKYHKNAPKYIIGDDKEGTHA